MQLEKLHYKNLKRNQIIILAKTITKFQFCLIQSIVHFNLSKRNLEVLTSLSNCFLNSSHSLFRISLYF